MQLAIAESMNVVDYYKVYGCTCNVSSLLNSQNVVQSINSLRQSLRNHGLVVYVES